MYIQKLIGFLMLVNYWVFHGYGYYEINNTVIVIKIIIKIITLFICPIIFGKLSLLFGTKPILLTTLILNIINNFIIKYNSIIREIINGLSGSALIAGTLLADASNLSNPVNSFRLIDFAFYIGILLLKIRDSKYINFLLSIINFIIAFIFFKETNTNIGITTDIISYIKIFSNPLVWSFLLFNIGWYLIGYYYTMDAYIIPMIIGRILFGPLSKFFGFNKLVIIGMIFGFLAILFEWLYKNYNKYEFNIIETIYFSLSFALVIPSLRTSIINTYDYNNYGLVLGALIGLQSVGWYMGNNLWQLFKNNEDERIDHKKKLATSASFLIVSLVIFLIYGRTGVNLLEK